MDATGQETPGPDARKSALFLLETKASQGDPDAQHELGLHYHRASFDSTRQDTAESRIEAYKWFCLAAAQEHKGSLTACQRLTLDMTRAEYDEGRRRATAFAVRKHPVSAQT